MKKFSECLLLVLVLGMILCPLLLFNFKSGQVSVVENRALAELSSDSSHPDVFMKSLDDCVNDRIGLRDEMMQLYNRVMYDGLKGNHGNVLAGEDGWLFFAEDLPDYTGTNINADTIEWRVTIAKAIDTWCAERGITFILAVGPNKSTIYSDFMPDTIYHEPYSATDRLVDRLREEGILVIYPKDELLSHKSEQELYYRLDTHWNAYGSRYHVEELIDILHLEKADIAVEERVLYTGDLLTMLGTGENKTVSLEACVEANPNAIIEKRNGTKEIVLESEDTVKFVCYRDSFTNALLEYYSYYFNGPVYWEHVIDAQLVEQEAPQVLILSSVERFFGAAISVNEHFVNLVS